MHRIALLLLPLAILPAADGLRIACIGDSITFGAGVDKREERSYPKVLEGLAKATVLNAGVSGSTLLQAGDRPYRKTGQFTAALAFRPTVVVIMLGTNDSKPQNWDTHKQDFAKDMGELIDTFAALDSKPAIWLCLPPPVQRANFGIRPEVVEKQIVPLIAAVAKERKLGTIDVFGALKLHPELFPDGVHPNVDGAGLVAHAVARVLVAPTSRRR
ncbi:MAG: hypothetical protein J0M02_02800 [Planctomycetes bacterium]|nr:hypothetical protein [Planctomycetota bacterium]